MFEDEYKRANDRIHPRKDLLKEMEAKWAAEQAQPAEEERGKVVAFPVWARFLGVAAGILLCVGVGMGSVLLFARGKGMAPMSADAAAPQMTVESAVEMEEAKIVVSTTADTAESEDAAMGEMLFEAQLAAAAAPVEGMHPATDEAEVEDAVRFDSEDRGAADLDQEANAEIPQAAKAEAKLAAMAEAAQYPAGTTMWHDELTAVFMPTVQQVHVVQYANRKVTQVFSLSMREKGAQIQKFFWEGDQMLGIQEKNGETRLIRTDVPDWNSPRHLKDLTQSGTFLYAEEMRGKIFILSLYQAAEEEPLPWVNGERMDYADVLLDSARPGDVFSVITVYDLDQRDGFVDQMAILTEARGAMADANRLLLWAGEGESSLYVLSWDDEEGLTLTAEDTRPGTVLDVGPAGESYSILMQSGEDLSLLTLDRDLNEEADVVAQAVGAAHFAQVYEGGAMALTDNALHWITKAGDAAVEMTGDAFTWLAPDRGLVLSADGQLQLVDIVGYEPVVRGSVKIKDSLALLIEDPSRLAYELEAGRLVFPAEQKVYQFLINDAGEFKQRGMAVNFGDHKDAEQRELRCLIMGDRILIFYKAGVAVYNMNLERQIASKY